MKKQSGFTLIEIVLALLIFTILATIVAVGLSVVIKAHERTETHLKHLQQLQIAMVLLQRDVQQIIDRPVSNNQGILQPTLTAQSNYLEFTHGGYINPFMLDKRSTLQRVAYEIKNQKFIRLTWRVLDRAPATQPLQRVLLDHVKDFQFSYIGNDNQLYHTWPPPVTNVQVNTFPKVIAITFTLPNWGTINRIFFIPEGASTP